LVLTRDYWLIDSQEAGLVVFGVAGNRESDALGRLTNSLRVRIFLGGARSFLDFGFLVSPTGSHGDWLSPHNGPNDASQGTVLYAALDAHVLHRTGDLWWRLPRHITIPPYDATVTGAAG